jgi:hypothetical protein
VARLALTQGATTAAAELIGAAEAERKRIGSARPPDERPFFEATARELEQALGRGEYERARGRGREKAFDAAVARALEYTAGERRAA